MKLEQQVARDLQKKLWQDVGKALEHYLMMAEVLDLPPAEQASAMGSVLTKMLIRLMVQIEMPKETMLRIFAKNYDRQKSDYEHEPN